MAIPKKTKYRYNHYPKYEGQAKGNQKLNYGDFGLQAYGGGTYVSDKTIEAGRRVISPFVKKGGKMWIRIFPHWGKTKKPLEVRMGSGKGSIESWVSVVKDGTIIYEVQGLSRAIAYEVLEKASHKLPKKKGIKWKVIERNE
ncbi:MAG: 50S ribosomal protein L16 [Candidatus Moeniiplasma glomeromycotorum]|nr:50S ribosomal protein L16 [Candidatus Moeniiplasma glomeromycotorum]MCE8168093.1 50S ribosomal protein L16 [Candidatus Moeniiplasma glomeromycotorum]MCE8169637.1 50S ribosomal protein L16 [Candidatus Moeniiplasma glomeromycotorum]